MKPKQNGALRPLVMAIGLVIGLAAPVAAQDDPLVIGSLNPNTGGMAVLGSDLNNWYQMAVDARNAEGGVLGRQIELVRGDATTAPEAIAAVERLVGREGAEVIVGTIASFLSQAGSEAALSSNVLYWETGALAKGLTERGLPNYVRSGPNTVAFAQVAANATVDMLAEALGEAPADLRVWVEYEDSNYGSSIAEEQVAVLGEAGVDVASSGHSNAAVDLTDSVLRAAEFAPDIWILAGYVADTHLLLRTAREQGFAPDAIIIVGLGDSQETVDALGLEYLQGVLVVAYPRQALAPSFAPESERLTAEYVDRYNQQPVGNSGFNGYAGLEMLFDAIEAAGTTDFEAVRAAAMEMDAPIGTYANGSGAQFDDTAQNTRSVAVMYQWQGDHTVGVYPLDARAEGVDLIDLARP